MSEKETPQDSNSSNALPPKRPMTVHILKNATKKETSRIELADAEAPTEAPGETLSVGDVAGSQSQDVAKSATSRVQLSDAETEIPEGSVPNAKDATARIILGDGSKPYSGSIHPAAKDATVRVDLTGLLERDASAGSEADQTARIDIPGMVSPAAPPRTVRLQRPGISPKTVILKRPGETTVPQTITLQRPDAEETTSESSKGATARISVPESAMAATPSSQRKTIMIRRPGAGGPASSARTLTLNRPAASVQAPREDLDEILQSLQTDEPGPVYSILALVAVLLLAALLYVLAAQTIAPTLPFPGRIA